MPQADRGDLYTLTAATFTVLTGFTRASPTGLGHLYDSLGQGGGQVGEHQALPTVKALERSGCGHGSMRVIVLRRLGPAHAGDPEVVRWAAARTVCS